MKTLIALLSLLTITVGCALTPTQEWSAREALYHDSEFEINMNGYERIIFNKPNGSFADVASMTPTDLINDFKKVIEWDRQMISEKNKIKVSKDVNSYMAGDVTIKYTASEDGKSYASICFFDNRYYHLKIAECAIVERADYTKLISSLEKAPIALEKIKKQIETQSKLK